MKELKSLTITLQADGFWHAWLRSVDPGVPEEECVKLPGPTFGRHLCCPDDAADTGGPWRSLVIALRDIAVWLERHNEPTIGGDDA